MQLLKLVPEDCEIAQYVKFSVRFSGIMLKKRGDLTRSMPVAGKAHRAKLACWRE